MVKEIIKQWAEDKEMGYELNTAIIFNQQVFYPILSLPYFSDLFNWFANPLFQSWN